MHRRGGMVALLFVLFFLLPILALWPENREYRVQAGDTLYSISRNFNIEQFLVMRANDIDDPRSLKVGQVLTIPDGADDPSADYSLEVYEIRLGDTLYSISRRTGMDVDDLLELNGLSEGSVIKPSQRIKVRASETRVLANIATPIPSSSPNAETQTTGLQTTIAQTTGAQTTSAQTTGSQTTGSQTTIAQRTGAASAAEGTILVNTPSVGGDDLFWPMTGDRYSFSGKFPGLVIKGASGAEVLAVSPGRVVYSGPHSTLGKVLFIQNPHGYIYIYGGNRDLRVAQGQEVRAGEVISNIGSVPLLPDVQLYFSVWKDGRYIDPTLAPR